MYFYDSYALIEMARGNPRYLRYRRGEGVTSKLNLLEAFYVLLQEGAEDLASICFEGHARDAIDFPIVLIPLAARFRYHRRGATGRRFSYADALGYTYARATGYSFLTGAHEFENFAGVEFVR
jgi:hypothetical protein